MRVLVDGAPVEVGGAGPLSLLACLILNTNRVVPIDELVEAMWGDEQPPSARRMVRMYAGRIRRALQLAEDGSPALVAEAPGFRLAIPPESVDGTRFERLLDEARRVRTDDPDAALRIYGEALALWRGPALAGVLCAEQDARRLDDLRISALEATAEARLALGELDGVICDLEQLVAKHPLRERLVTLLMMALYRAGRQTDALDRFKAYRRTLVDELGVEPGAEVRQLELAILRQDPVLDTPARSPGLPVRPAAQRPARRLRLRPRVLVAAALLAAGAVTAAVLLSGSSAATLKPGALGVFDARSHRLLAHVPVEKEPTSLILLGGSRALVATREDRSVALVDWSEGRVLGRFGTGIAGGKLVPYQAILHRTAVVADQESRQLAVLDLGTRGANGLDGTLIPLPVHLPFSSDGIRDIVRVPGGGAYVTSDGWVVSIGTETHYEWEELARYKIATTSGPLAYARGMIWMAPRGAQELIAFNLGFGKVTRRIPLSGPARAIAASGDDLWVALAKSATLLRYSASTSSVVGRSDLGGTPTLLNANGRGAWLATADGRVLHVSRARPEPEVVADVHHPIGALAVQADRVVVALK